VVLRVVFKGWKEGLKAWVLMILKGILLIPSPGFLDKDGIGLAVPG
jgi:hypothetical protein